MKMRRVTEIYDPTQLAKGVSGITVIETPKKILVAGVRPAHRLFIKSPRY